MTRRRPGIRSSSPRNDLKKDCFLGRGFGGED
ncbi:hypothetical protein H206_05341 [Candidatus Electrothrix aarhusensis]|uniref:Uncharacterized protein n=1 Tax=Candidatus Electrothrix aarhusensis TaxID=1859131 RepID=A0A444J4V0_9BACT|nr:hypothetical protein H206_05341 [Candidatus Electrothrix aarhusensis]